MNVLFDLDGTLTDPKEGITKSVQFALAQMGVEPPPAERLEWLIGPPLQNALAKLLKNEDPDASRECLDHYRKRFSEVGLYENVVYEGIPELLATLQSLGCRLFVATSKPTLYAVQILHHFQLAEYFEAIHGSELDGVRSNKHELVAHILATEGLNREETVLVGDREHDVYAAAANGIGSVGVLYGYGCEDELLDGGVDEVAETPEGVLLAIKRRLNSRARS